MRVKPVIIRSSVGSSVSSPIMTTTPTVPLSLNPPCSSPIRRSMLGARRAIMLSARAPEGAAAPMAAVAGGPRRGGGGTAGCAAPRGAGTGTTAGSGAGVSGRAWPAPVGVTAPVAG